MTRMSDEGIARGVSAFVSTLRHTAGMTKQEVKHALHPKMIDLIWKIENDRATSPSSEEQS
jgi:hypothetical protein